MRKEIIIQKKEVEQPIEPEKLIEKSIEEPKEKSIKDMTKKEFDEYALTKFNIKLNRTYTKKNMIKQFNKEMNKK